MGVIAGSGKDECIMKNLFKLIAALAVLAGVVLLVLEFMKRRDEDDKRKSDRALRDLVKSQREKGDGLIADYRYDDDEFFADSLDDEAAEDDCEIAEEDSFDLSEDALEQLLDS